MKTPEDVLTDEDFRYLKIAISLALTGVDIEEMPKTKVTLNELYDKIERMEEAKNP
jgi:hypothetical protein